MLKSLEISGFKSFATKSTLDFDAPISAIVGPNGSGKSNTAEAFRFVLGEQSLKTLRVNKTEELLFNGGESGRRRNRAHVKATLDNSQDILDIEYDEVVVERIIERGDASTYRLNGSRVRLKDVTDLLADASIGTSRHHIISQGETDRVLNVTNRQRKSIIEDALGLGGYYRRRKEAQNKLARTEDNLEEIRTQLEEIKPEFNYLKKKKRRIEKTKKLRNQLTDKYRQYFRRKEMLLSRQEKALKEKKSQLSDQLSTHKRNAAELKEKITELESEDNQNKQEDKISNLKSKLNSVTTELKEANEKRAELVGSIQTLQSKNQQDSPDSPKPGDSQEKLYIHKNLLSKYKADIEQEVEAKNDSSVNTLDKLITLINDFFGEFEFTSSDSKRNSTDTEDIESERIAELQEKKEQAVDRCQKLKTKKQEIKDKLESARSQSKDQESRLHKLEKQLLKTESKQETTATKLENVMDKLDSIANQREQIEEEKSEAKVLCGPEALQFDDIEITDQEGNSIDPESITSEGQRKFSRGLERLKVKLEDTRVSNPKEVEAEFSRVKERIEFFQEEIADLTQTQSQLEGLIDDIEKTAERKFKSGIQEINDTFNSFFTTMFGGGSAELTITEHPAGRNVLADNIDESPEETELGIDITVKLPNKKIRGLDILSGGERALTSVALLFSLSQINPPPFMVLDEVDAALDEANSKRFGNIVEKLSEQSQLIIITHNRETMRRAELLYGVTMDNDGSSRLLSLDFSEAVDNINPS
jgi:chromosome segregation protein